jgi:hypothetical protein
MKATVILFCLALLNCGGEVCAQETPILEDLLRWFPAGHYGRIVHFDREAFVSSCPSELRDDYLSVGRRMFPAGAPTLPPSLVDRFDSETRASRGRAQIVNAYEITESGEMRRLNRKCAFAFEANGRYYGAYMSSAWMYAYRFAGLDALVRAAVRSGKMEALQVEIENRQVYCFRPESRPAPLYGYATITGELLVAENLPDLKAMVRAGTLDGAPIFRTMDLSGLLEASSDLGHTWSYYNHVALYRTLLEYLSVKDSKSPDLATLADLVENDVQYVLDDYRWDSGGYRIQRTVICFGNEKTAADEYLQMKQGGGRYYEPLQQACICGRVVSLGRLNTPIKQARALSKVESSLTLDRDRVVLLQTDDRESLVKTLDAFTTYIRDLERKKN